MKLLSISGGGTKIAGLAGAAETILTQKNYAPDIITGVSAGAILAVPLALGKFKEIRHIVFNLKMKDFFNVCPVDKKGNIRKLNAIWRIIRGERSLGEQWNLEKTLGKVVTKNWFDEYRTGQYPICIVGSVDFKTGARVYVNLKEVTYELFLKFVNASASIPIFTPGIKMDGLYIDFEDKVIPTNTHLYDGGVRDHSPAGKILSSEKYKITETAQIYSRPEDYGILKADGYKSNNILSILNRYVDITNTEVSKNDELIEDAEIAKKGIKNHGTFYLPSIMEGVYDVNQDRLIDLYYAGMNEVTNKWKD